MYFLLVKVKFNLEPDVVISLEDDHGAEVDDEVFPTLWEQGGTPNIVFNVKDEGPTDDATAIFLQTLSRRN